MKRRPTSSRISIKTYKGPPLPESVIKLIFEAYVEVYRSDTTARIIPLLLANMRFERLLTPIFYHHIAIQTSRQLSYLGFASPRALRSIRTLTFLPCPGGHAGRTPYCPNVDEQKDALTGPEEDRGLETAWTVPWRLCKVPSLNLQIDVLHCQSPSGLLHIGTASMLRPRALVYDPTDSCIDDPADHLDFFLDAYTAVKVPHWEMDLTGVFRQASEQFSDPKAWKRTEFEDRDLFDSFMDILGPVIGQTAGKKAWLDECGLQSRIKVTSRGLPYVFWDPDHTHSKGPRHVFACHGGVGCYGPKTTRDDLLGRFFHRLVGLAIKKAGFEWQPPYQHLQAEGDGASKPRLPEEIMRHVLSSYIQVYRADENTRIMPLLLTCRSFHDVLIPLLYDHIRIRTARQARLLGRCSSRALHLIKKVVFMPCRLDQDDHNVDCISDDDARDRNEFRDCIGDWAEHIGPIMRDFTGRTTYTWGPDEAHCLSGFGPREGVIMQLRPKKITYDPQNMDCPMLGDLTRHAYEFTRMVPIYRTAKAWEFDVTWLFDEALADVGDILETLPLAIAMPRAANIIMGKLCKVFELTAYADWIKETILEERIKIKSRGHPYALWDPFGTFAKSPKHMFDFEGGPSCFGPRALDDIALSMACHGMVVEAIRAAGKEWNPPAAESKIVPVQAGDDSGH